MLKDFDILVKETMEILRRRLKIDIDEEIKMSKVGEYYREEEAMQQDPAYILRNGARTLTDEDKKEAIEFAGGNRGTYIISQALHIAINKLMEEKEEFRELSNISDMQYLRDYLFNQYPIGDEDNDKR